MPISTVNRVRTITLPLTSASGSAVIPIYENSDLAIGADLIPNHKIISFNCFIKNLKAFSSIKSLPEIALPNFELEDSTTDKLYKTLDIEWGSARKQLSLYIASGTNDWSKIGSVSLLNPSGYPFRVYNLMDLYTDNLALELGENSKVGVGIDEVGYGLLSATDTVTIHGSYVEEIFVLHPDATGVTIINQSGGSIDDLEGTLNLFTSKLTSDRTYYVSATGNDINNGLSNTTPYATIQRAIDTASRYYIPEGIRIFINVLPGVYTLYNQLKSFSGGGSIHIIGDTANPQNVIISTTDDSCFYGGYQEGWYWIGGFKFQTTSWGHVFDFSDYGYFRFFDCDFGSCAGSHVSLVGNGVIARGDRYKISGSAESHIALSNGASLLINSNTTINGTPNFTTAFINAKTQSRIKFDAEIIGAVTGKAYTVASLALLEAFTNVSTFIPGNIAGTTESGGVYLKPDGTTL